MTLPQSRAPRCIDPARLRRAVPMCAMLACAILGSSKLASADAPVTAPMAPVTSPVDAPVRVVGTWPLVDIDLAMPTTPPPTHELRLELAMVSGTRWTPDVVLDAARRAGSLLAQCGIALRGGRLTEFDGPREYRYLRTPVSREFARRARLVPPAVFFVDDTLERPAFDAEAIGRGNSASRREMADTVWVAFGIRDLPVALAHELVHVLGDSGMHSQLPDNLMREDTAYGNTHLTDAQCQRMIAVGETNRLLTRIGNVEPAAK